jgi:hypothetical protein
MEILPWIANGTVAEEDLRVAEEHLTDCEACREELSFLRRFSATAKKLQQDLPAVEDGFAKTLDAIEHWESRKPRGVIQRFLPFIGPLWPATPGPIRVLVAAQLAVIVALGGFFIWESSEARFGTLSGGGTPDGSAVRLDVAFHPGVSEKSMREVLLETGGSIVSGPSALGIYVIEIPINAADLSDTEAVIRQLRIKTDVIRFVERQP